MRSERRRLIAYLMRGGFIEPDDSGLGWVAATRDQGAFANTLVERLRANGFVADFTAYAVVEHGQNRGRWYALERAE